MADVCFCFFERKPDLLKINQTKNLIKEFESRGFTVSEHYVFTEEVDLVDVLFKNPTEFFINTLKDKLGIELKPCFEK